MKIEMFRKDEHAELYRAGTPVFRVGEQGDRMFAVLDGEVDIVIHGKLVETVGAGGVFGEMALIEDRPRIATAEVRQDARLVPIDKRRFQFLVQQNPFFALQLMGIMAERLRRMDEKL